ncbi:MAG: glycerol-3-phosphate 1-O-acyltransferase PlsY [Clostridiales bacterium]|nr:glycerol-3-phosphate 1-O-acyltransferase PlsY [Clostridiales bacterium]
MALVYTIAVAVIAYLIGSINSSILISKAVTGKDIRTSGSGNAGATNMLRTMGKKYAVITLVIDILKGVVALLLAKLAINLGAYTSATYIAGVAVVLGHNFPVFFGFKGGKGVATSLGVVLLLDWKIGLITLVVALAVMAISKYVSLGSITAAVIFMVLQIVAMAVTDAFDVSRLICVLILGGLLIIRHRANIARLANGTENKLGSKKKEA